MNEDPYQTSTTEHPKTLDLLVADVIGPFRTTSHDGSQNYLVIRDVGGHYGWVLPLKIRKEAPSKLMDLIRMLGKHYPTSVKHVQLDNAPEFTSESINTFFHHQDIQRRSTIPYAHAQNGAFERYSRTIQERARVPLISAQLPPSFWGAALQTAVYLENRLTTRGATRGVSAAAYLMFYPAVS
ncbi:hypothetical protein SeLEV6574_g03149 [Synchytrium endobioticum]|uniref:Integrase catalytic domain-containing protein n=1 Tax=Synchytrium endobioticum TaxID=286115 RepID=A0A507D5N0_9FUNG|nr:hypothetical protein SeLEV6574_g03149 [Synchytrium endobioticum]